MGQNIFWCVYQFVLSILCWLRHVYESRKGEVNRIMNICTYDILESIKPN